MSELAAKLARRRALNGESGASESIPSQSATTLANSSSSTSTPTPSTTTNSQISNSATSSRMNSQSISSTTSSPSLISTPIKVAPSQPPSLSVSSSSSSSPNNHQIHKLPPPIPPQTSEICQAKYPTEISSKLFDSLDFEPYFDPTSSTSSALRSEQNEKSNSPKFHGGLQEIAPSSPLPSSPQHQIEIECKTLIETKAEVEAKQIQVEESPPLILEKEIVEVVESELAIKEPQDMNIDQAEEIPSVETSPSYSTRELEIAPTEMPSLKPKKSDLDEFEDFLETIDKDLVGDFPIFRSSNEKLNLEEDLSLSNPSPKQFSSSNFTLDQHQDLQKEVQSLRKIYHDKTQRFNHLQRELTSLRLTLQPQSKNPGRSASLFQSHHHDGDNTDEFLSKFDDFQKTSSRHSRRNQGGTMFDEDIEPQHQRLGRKSDKVDEVERNLFYVPTEQYDDVTGPTNSPELIMTLKDEISSLTQRISEKDLQITKLESDIQTENERVRSRSLSSAESDGSGPSGIAALRNTIDHMGFDSEKVSSLLSDSFPISSEDQLNLDRLMLLPSSSSTLQASSASLLSESQMGFVFLKHKVYNYDNGDAAVKSSNSESSHQHLTGLFAKDDGQIENITSQEGNNNLFKEDKPARKPQSSNAAAGGNTKIIHYQEFLDRLMNPKSSPICNAIRNFLMSVLGPNGDCSPPSTDWKLDYEFHGIDRLSTRCCDFMDAIIEHMTTATLWRGDSEEGYIAIRDYLEKYLLTKIGKYAFQSVECPEEDSFLLKRMELLHFIQTKHLDIKPELCNDLVWTLARDELRKINSYDTPVDKIACIMRCSSVIFRSLNLARAKTEDTVNSTDDDQAALSAPGADDFLPLLIWVVMHCHIPKLISNCEYIQNFHNPIHLRGKAGYCLVNLRSAMEFVLNLDHQDISHMTEEEFKQLIAR